MKEDRFIPTMEDVDLTCRVLKWVGEESHHLWGTVASYSGHVDERMAERALSNIQTLDDEILSLSIIALAYLVRHQELMAVKS